MNLQIFIMGILTVFSPLVAFLQDIGWRLGDPDDLRSRMFNWVASLTWEQRLLARGMILAGFLLMGAGVLWGRGLL